MDIKYITAMQKLESMGYVWQNDEWVIQSQYGCHCDLYDGQEPDSCVIDSGKINECVYARRLDVEGKGKTSCKYWQVIKFENK